MTTSSDAPHEGQTGSLTWSEFLRELGMPPDLRTLSEAQMQRGICSASDCEQAIDGWCEECGAKLCGDDLEMHRHFGCEDAHALSVDVDDYEDTTLYESHDSMPWNRNGSDDIENNWPGEPMSDAEIQALAEAERERSGGDGR